MKIDKTTKVILSVACAASLLIIGANVAQWHIDKVKSSREAGITEGKKWCEVKTAKTEKDSQLMQKMSQIAKVRSGEYSLKYVDSVNCHKKDECSDDSATGGGYFSPDSQVGRPAEIVIKRGLDENTELTVLAHEFLHYVWERNGWLHGNTKLTSRLLRMWQSDSNLRKRMQNYVDSDTLVPTELFSFVCTEWKNSSIDSYILEQCDSFIDRTKLKLLY